MFMFYLMGTIINTTNLSNVTHVGPTGETKLNVMFETNVKGTNIYVLPCWYVC